MYCGNCGASLPEGARFCGACGAPCEAENEPVYPRPEPTTREAEPSFDRSAASTAPAAKPPKAKRSGLASIITFVVVFVLAFGVYRLWDVIFPELKPEPTPAISIDLPEIAIATPDQSAIDAMTQDAVNNALAELDALNNGESDGDFAVVALTSLPQRLGVSEKILCAGIQSSRQVGPSGCDRYELFYYGQDSGTLYGFMGLCRYAPGVMVDLDTLIPDPNLPSFTVYGSGTYYVPGTGESYVEYNVWVGGLEDPERAAELAALGTVSMIGENGLIQVDSILQAMLDSGEVLTSVEQLKEIINDTGNSWML